MKKLLLSFSLLFAIGSINAQSLYTYGFNNGTAGLTTDGWVRTNQSSPATATLWGIPTAAPTATFSGGAQSLPAISFALVNFTSVGVLTPGGTTPSTGSGPISNWLISPSITVQNGDVISFYSRLGQNATSTTTEYPDRLQLRMSTDGGFTTDPSTGPTDVGTFTNLLVDINPNLVTGIYPRIWTNYTYTVTGLSSPTDVKFGFRYFVNDGGQDGANSNIIGIDTFSVDRPLATESFFTQNFKVYPNPATTVVNLSSKNNTTINQVQITDLNGRVIKSIAVNEVATQINIADLNSGVYFLKATSNNGVGVTKIVKK